MHSDIFTLLRTVEERTNCLTALDEFEAGQYALKKETAPVVFADFFTTEKDLRALRDLLVNAPLFHLTLAFIPDADFIAQLSSLVRTEKNDLHILLAIDQEPEIGAGAIMSFGGKRVDDSLRAKVAALDLKKITQSYMHLE